MNNSYIRSIIFCILLTWSYSVFSDTSNEKLLATVKSFYGWVLTNGHTASELEPKIVNIPGSTRFFLDTTSLQAFSDKLMSSNMFSQDFSNAVKRYYKKYENDFNRLSKNDFDEYESEGGRILMEVQDMDIYFCAQEYDYTPDFVKGQRIVNYKINGNHATAVIESPFKWKTTFNFKQVNGNWLISGYCVFK
jgi:hypothetical protein